MIKTSHICLENSRIIIENQGTGVENIQKRNIQGQV